MTREEMIKKINAAIANQGSDAEFLELEIEGDLYRPIEIRQTTLNCQPVYACKMYKMYSDDEAEKSIVLKPETLYSALEKEGVL